MERSRSAWLLLLILGLAGCADDPAQPNLDGNADAATIPTNVYRVGEVLNATTLTELLPQIPNGTARYLGAGGFEPTLGLNAEGVIFYSAYNYDNTEDGDVFRSFDQGVTWEEVSPEIGGEQYPPASNDNYVYVDVDTGRVFTSDLQLLVCSTLSWSDDEADTWTTNPIGCGHPVGVHDHQTVWTATPRFMQPILYTRIVYYCVNRLVDTACATSLNGGLTFGPLRPLVFNDVTGANGPQEPCGGLTAHGQAAPDGTVYLPKGDCGIPKVAISRDDGLTWDVVTISQEIAAPDHEVAFAVDEAGHAYAFWISDDLQPYLAASPDGGTTWNAPVLIAPPGVKTTDFPTIAAGSDGRVAMAYYGTTAEKGYGNMNATDVWNAYMTITTNALAPAPVFATVTANNATDPVARGPCGGSRCSGVGDFIDVVIDAEGRPWAAFVDVCNEGCATGQEDANEGVEAFVGTLSAGPRLRGALEALPSLATA